MGVVCCLLFVPFCLPGLKGTSDTKRGQGLRLCSSSGDCFVAGEASPPLVSRRKVPCCTVSLQFWFFSPVFLVLCTVFRVCVYFRSDISASCCFQAAPVTRLARKARARETLAFEALHYVGMVLGISLFRLPHPLVPPPAVARSPCAACTVLPLIQSCGRAPARSLVRRSRQKARVPK